ncbi:MAG: hypothetical protein M0019_08690 [Actinomycetota bacterium]|nr:hypothetical protein [Actinomycetota bacterium]
MDVVVRKIADGNYFAYLCADDELVAFGKSETEALRALGEVVEVELGVSARQYQFEVVTQRGGPLPPPESEDDPERAAIRRASNETLRIARRALRKLVVDDNLTLAQAAARLGISPIQAQALVDHD